MGAYTNAEIQAILANTAPSYLNELLLRFKAIEEEALAGVSGGVTAYEYYWVKQDFFPYLTNRLDALSYVFENGSEEWGIQFKVIVRLIIGHMTSGYQAEREKELLNLIPIIIQAFAERTELQSTLYQSTMPDLEELTYDGGVGYGIFTNAPAVQVGTEFNYTVKFSISIPPKF